jgi:hypothetical protein
MTPLRQRMIEDMQANERGPTHCAAPQRPRGAEDIAIQAVNARALAREHRRRLGRSVG